MRQNRKAGVALFAMNRVTHDTIFKRGVIEYSFKNGVTAAAIRYKTTRQISTVGVRSMTALLVLLQTVLIVPHSHTTGTSRQKSSSSAICGAETRILGQWCFG